MYDMGIFSSSIFNARNVEKKFFYHNVIWNPNTTHKSIYWRFILRNYIAQNAIDYAEKGDYSEVHRVLKLLENPYSDSVEFEISGTQRTIQEEDTGEWFYITRWSCHICFICIYCILFLLFFGSSNHALNKNPY